MRRRGDTSLNHAQRTWLRVDIDTLLSSDVNTPKAAPE